MYTVEAGRSAIVPAAAVIQVHQLRWRASWDPTSASIPDYLSASGPNMVKLAGEVSDGVGVGSMSTPT